MGMYDMLGSSGDQVKCFPVPVFYYHEENTSSRMLGYMGGNLRSYAAGDEVPYRTLWYRYPKDFMVVDTTDSDYNEAYCDATVHIIRDGKYCRTFDSIRDLSDEDILPCSVSSYYGDIIHNIVTLANLKEYLHARHDATVKRMEILQQSNDAFASLLEYLRGKSCEDLEKDEQYHALAEAADIAQRERDEKLSAASRKLQTHYLYVTDAETEERKLFEAGGYLEVYRRHLSRLGSDSREEQVVTCICREFNNYLTQHPSISLDNYLKLLDGSENAGMNITECWHAMQRLASDNS